MSDAGRILVVDDEAEILENLARILEGEGLDCRALQDPRAVRTVLEEFHPDVLVTDLKMPGADGMTLLSVARADRPDLPVILMTGFASISSAVEAMQEGAFDYLAKPFSADQFLVTVERALRHCRLLRENRELRAEIERGSSSRKVIGTSAAFARILEQVRRVAPTDAGILVTGESGTGKEVVARLIHESSRRADAPFIPVDCAALPDGLLESELFGHEKGAFTGAITRRRGLLEEAAGGTVFLDEIGDMSLGLQAKLLRSLEQLQVRPVGGGRFVDLDVRLLAATNIDLRAAVAEGSFREDLYYRLNVVELVLPPLRARIDDLPLLASAFLAEAAASAGRETPTIDPAAWETLERYHWPGNIRQLRNLMRRVVALDDDGRVGLSDLPPEVRSGQPTFARPTDGTENPRYPTDYQAARDLAMEWFMQSYLEQLLTGHDGNVTRAADSAGVSRRTVHRWMAEYLPAAHGNGNGTEAP